MKRKRLWTIVAILLLTALLVPGCAGPTLTPEKTIVRETVTVKETQQVVVTATPPATFSWNKYAGTTIRVLGPTHQFVTDTIQGLLPAFEKETGIKVKIENYPEAQTWEKIGVELMAGNKDLDVIYYQPQRSGAQYVEAGWLEPLEPYVKNPLLTSEGFDFPDDFFAGSIGDGTVAGKLIAIPTDRDQAPLMFYNKEILEKYGIEVPKTLADLEAAAKKIRELSNGQIYGIVNRGRGADITSQFAWVMNEFGARWEDANGKPTINTPEWIAAAEWWSRTLRESGPPGVTNYSWQECVNDIQQGKAAFTLETALNPNYMNDPANSRVVGKIGVTVIPYGPAYKNGDDSYRHASPCKIASRFGMSINANSTKKEAAWLFVAYMSSKEAQLNYQLVGRPAARNSAWTSPTFKTAVRSDAWYWDARIESADICYASVGYAPPSIKNTAQARDIIGRVIQGGILGEDVKTLAASAQAELEKMLAEQK